MKIFIPHKVRTLLAFIAFLVFLFFVNTCHAQKRYKRQIRRADHRVAKHWIRENRRGIEKYTFVARVFPIDDRCSTYDNGRQPVKSSIIRRLHFYRRVRG